MTINKILSADSIKDVLCAIDEFCQEQLRIHMECLLKQTDMSMIYELELYKIIMESCGGNENV